MLTISISIRRHQDNGYNGNYGYKRTCWDQQNQQNAYQNVQGQYYDGMDQNGDIFRHPRQVAGSTGIRPVGEDAHQTSGARQLGPGVNWTLASTGPRCQLDPGVNWAPASTGPWRQLGPRVWTAGWNGLRTPMPVLRSTHIQCRMGMGHSSRRLNGSDVSTANRGGNRMDNRQILREISKRISAPYQRQKLSSAPR